MVEKRVLVVGAGFAGSVYARSLAEAGIPVLLIDRRPHVAGNAYDEVGPDGVRVHMYGPHIFHTSNERVVRWVTRFARFQPYQHKVAAALPDGRFVPLPITRATVNAVFGTRLSSADETKAFLSAQAEGFDEVRNAAEHLHATIGRVLTDLFFRPYTRKMWALDLEDLDPAVVRRIPLRFDDDDRYFPDDSFQGFPEGGYARLFEAILDHPNITVRVATSFEHAMLPEFDHCFNSMPIDEFFACDEGPLPYRSIRFHSRSEAVDGADMRAVINFTDDGPYTRRTDWQAFPGHRATETGRTTLTYEEPCDYRENGMERYYPVRASDDRFESLYRRYRQRSEARRDVTFIGRCGTYRYLDMHQVINQSLAGAQAFIAGQHRSD